MSVLFLISLQGTERFSEAFDHNQGQPLCRAGCIEVGRGQLRAQGREVRCAGEGGLIPVQAGSPLPHVSPRSDDPCPASFTDHGAEEIMDEKVPYKRNH